MAHIRQRYVPRRRKKRGKKILTFFAAIAVIALIIGLGYSFAAAVGFIDLTDDLNIDRLQLNYTSVIYCTDPHTGEEVEFEKLHGNENREWTDLMDIPEHVQKAAIAIEDERFYKHRGFDIKSTTKAAFNYIFKHSTSRGASTITQQLVKNLTGDSEKSVGRKAKEILRAVNVEKKMTKDEILELYLNTIYLSQGCSGIGSAAEVYFGKDVSDLTIAEGAALVGITQYPTYYDPILNPENNREKQLLVLEKMRELKYITQEEYDQAVNEEMHFKSAKENEKGYSYFVDEVIERALSDLQTELGYTEAVAVKMLYNSGLKIYATVDPEVQKIMDDVYSDDSVFYNPGWETLPQSSMVIMDPYNGEVKGLVGGRGEKQGSRSLNRATGTYRQPGSTIKPVAVYGPALEENVINAGSVFEDKAIKYGSWAPKNVYEGYKGKVTVRYAVEQSINTIAVQVLDKLGVNKSYDYMTKKLGFTSLNENDKALAGLGLGGLTKGVSNLELTAAYCSFPNNGLYTKPVLYTKITDNTGKVLIDNTDPSKRQNRAFSNQTATIMLNILKGVVEKGTGTGAYFNSLYDTAGKTGSTDNNKDKWFVGITPYYVGTVWYGYDIPRELHLGGMNPAVPVWRAVMQKVHAQKNLASKHFEIAKGVTKVTYCSNTGLLPCSICYSLGTVRTDYFKSGTVPTKTCSGVHSSGTGEDPDETPDPDATDDPNATADPNGNTSFPSVTASPVQPEQTTQTNNNTPSVVDGVGGGGMLEE